MAKKHSATYKMREPQESELDDLMHEIKVQRTEADVKELFSSVQWYYPVHKYIGDIVQKNKFGVDYEQEHKRICFEWYCGMFSEFMEYFRNWQIIAASVLKVLPTDENVTKGLPSDAVALISGKDVVYILGTYNLEYFDYLLGSFAIELKYNCLDFMQKQLQALTGMKPVMKDLKDLKDYGEEFVAKQQNKLFEQRTKLVHGIKRSVNKYLSRTTPLSFIMSEEMDPQKMPPVPRDLDPKSWEDYFLQVCIERLALTLDKEKKQWDDDSSKHRYLHCLTNPILRMLTDEILENPGVSPEKSAKVTFMTEFREEISKLIS